MNNIYDIKSKNGTTHAIKTTKPNFFIIIFLSCRQGGARATLHPPFKSRMPTKHPGKFA
jgi:hypothetical protein